MRAPTPLPPAGAASPRGKINKVFLATFAAAFFPTYRPPNGTACNFRFLGFSSAEMRSHAGLEMAIPRAKLGRQQSQPTLT